MLVTYSTLIRRIQRCFTRPSILHRQGLFLDRRIQVFQQMMNLVALTECRKTFEVTLNHFLLGFFINVRILLEWLEERNWWWTNWSNDKTWHVHWTFCTYRWPLCESCHDQSINSNSLNDIQMESLSVNLTLELLFRPSFSSIIVISLLSIELVNFLQSTSLGLLKSENTRATDRHTDTRCLHSVSVAVSIEH